MKVVRAVLWILTAALFALTLVRLQNIAAGVAPDVVEDRRQHHFRDWTYTRTETLAASFLEQAGRAGTDAERALALARLAALQRERGLHERAEAAAREALRLAGGDAEVRRVLAAPLDLRDGFQ